MVEEVVDRTSVTADGRTWTLEMGDLSLDAGVATVNWLVTRDHSETMLLYDLVMRRNGERVGSFEKLQAGSAAPTDGTFNFAAEPGDSIELEWIVNEEEDIRFTLTGTLPETDTAEVELTPSPIPIPTWASSMHEPFEIDIPGETDGVTLPTVESVDAEAVDDGVVDFTAVVGTETVFGTPQTVTTTLTANTDSGRNRHAAEEDLTLDPGEEVEVTGRIHRGSPGETLTVDLTNEAAPRYVEDTPDLFSTEPLEQIEIPEFTDESVGEPFTESSGIGSSDSDRQLWAIQSDIDGYSYANINSDENFIMAVLAWREGHISDVRMAVLRAMHEAETFLEADSTGSILFGALDGDPERVYVTVGADSRGPTTPDSVPFYARGPNLSTEEHIPRSEGSYAFGGLLPGERYEFGIGDAPTDTPRVYPELTDDVRAEVEVADAIPDPEPDPEPDPDPVEPSVDAACDFDGAEINVGGSVTIPVDVTAGDGDTDTEATVEIEVAGQTASETVTLEPNSSARVEATYEIAEPGEYTPTITLS